MVQGGGIPNQFRFAQRARIVKIREGSSVPANDPDEARPLAHDNGGFCSSPNGVTKRAGLLEKNLSRAGVACRRIFIRGLTSRTDHTKKKPRNQRACKGSHGRIETNVHKISNLKCHRPKANSVCILAEGLLTPRCLDAFP